MLFKHIRLSNLGGGRGELYIIWPQTWDCNIRFEDVFDKSCFNEVNLTVIECKDPMELCLSNREKKILHTSCRELVKDFFIIKAAVLYCKKKIVFHHIHNRGKDKGFKKLLNYDGRRLQIYTTYPPRGIGWCGERFIKYNRKVVTNIEKVLQDRTDIYISAYCGFLNDDRSFDYSELKFKKEYWDIVREILKGNDKIIGIHVRRTDHDMCKKYSTLDIFIDKMREALEEDGETFFFLATDDNEVENQLLEIFPGRIIVNPQKIWGRDSNDGMKSGIVDLLCLSSCKYIIGSYGSAFSAFAARYGRKKLEICKK